MVYEIKSPYFICRSGVSKGTPVKPSPTITICMLKGAFWYLLIVLYNTVCQLSRYWTHACQWSAHGAFEPIIDLHMPARKRRSHDHVSPASQVGWREWVALPDLGIQRIKAKIDTGARTSTLHAYFVKEFRLNGKVYVRFGIHPAQRRTDQEILCQAEVHDHRLVSDSGGHREKRYVIVTLLRVGDKEFPIELTLTNRDTMMFRMLIGRTALNKRFIVDPARSYLTHP